MNLFFASSGDSISIVHPSFNLNSILCSVYKQPEYDCENVITSSKWVFFFPLQTNIFHYTAPCTQKIDTVYNRIHVLFKIKAERLYMFKILISTSKILFCIQRHGTRLEYEHLLDLHPRRLVCI